MRQKQLVLWSPGIESHGGRASANLGDLIIEEYIRDELEKIFADWEVKRIATHRRLGPAQRRLVKGSDLVIVGGSNLLSSYMDGYFQWDLTMANAWAARGAVLLGAGWWRDQGPPNRYTKVLLHLVLSRKYQHSVRDGQAKKHLREAGIKKVLNTAWPTMWGLAEMAPERIRTTKGKQVLCMLTDYWPAPETDTGLLELLKSRYGKLYIWPQGRGDMEYVRDLGFGEYLTEGGIASLDGVLEAEKDLDYVGTRLHGGIRCMRKGKRCMTLETDNRAREIGRDTGLPTLPREDLAGVAAWIDGSKPVKLSLPMEAIEEWRGQFDSIR